MNKKMMKRSLALGALMAFVITGSAMAADESYGSTMLDKDVTVTGGNLTYTADKSGIEGGNIGYALGVVDGGSHTITLDAGKTLFVKNFLEGTDRNYGIVTSNIGNLIVNSIVDVEVNAKDSTQARAIRVVGDFSGNDKVTFNDNVQVKVDSKGNGTNNVVAAGVEAWQNSNITFNGDSTVIEVKGDKVNAHCVNVDNSKIEFNADRTIINNDSTYYYFEIDDKGNYNWANCILSKGEIVLGGKEAILSSNNKGFTAQVANVLGSMLVSSEKAVFTAKSDYGATGIGGYGLVTFTGKEVTINAYVTTGAGKANALGLASRFNITDTVKNFNINIEGAGQDGPGADGTAGIATYSDEENNISCENLFVKVTAGIDTDNCKFDENNVEYAVTNGISSEGSIKISENTNTSINVYDRVKGAVGIFANTDIDLNGENEYSPGKVVMLGNTIVIASDSSDILDSKSLYAKKGSSIEVGSKGKKVKLVGDVVSDGNILYKNNKYVSNISIIDADFDVTGNFIAQNEGIINLSGNTTFAADKNRFETDATGLINLAGGNMSGSLNITKDSKVNLTGATFTANDLKASLTGKGKLVLTDNGVLSTTANQIFTKADTVGKEAGDVLQFAQDKVDFVSGTVNLTDAEYTLDYARNAKENINKLTYDNVNSNTNIVMSGNLVGNDLEDNKVTVDDATQIGGDVALDKVTAEADGNLLVGSTEADKKTVEGIEIKDSVANGFNVGSLELAAGSNGMVITNNKEVTLGGSKGGTVITVKDGTADTKVTVVVGTSGVVDGASKTTGTLNIGNALANADTKYTLTGSVIVNNDSTLNTKGNTTITEDLELNNGTVNVVNGSLDVKNINVMEGDNNTITGNVSASALSVDVNQNNVVINVGTADVSASTSFESVNLNGSTICFDPAWDKAAGQHGWIFGSDKTNDLHKIDGNVLVARNNYLAIGTDDTSAAKTMFEKSGLKFGEKDITAVLYIAGNQSLASGGALDPVKGSIYVDGSKTGKDGFENVKAGTFSAVANSLTMVDGSKINGNNVAALGGVTSAAIDQDSAKLYIDGAKKGEIYHVLDGADAGWADKNIISDNSLLEFKGDTATDDKYDVTASLKKVNTVYGNKVIIANVVDNTLEKHDKSAAAAFFNAAVSSKNNASKDAQISALNSAGAMSELAGVAHSTYAVSNILTDAVADHVSLSNDHDYDSDIWAHYVHNKENVEGLAVANFGADYDAQYNGIVVGGDFYKKDKVVAGAALTYVDGNINGSSLAARTENDAEFYGVSVYGSVTNNDNAVIGDISYLHGKHDITQRNSGMSLTGEPESDAFSVGVRVEKSIESKDGKFVPYAGLRYMHVGTANYTNSIGMSYDAEDANLFLLPVGLKYSAETKAGKWTIRPVAELGYVWAMGDTDSAQTVSLNGAADGFGYDVTDSGSYFARIGVQAERNNVTYGLGYEYQKGDSVKANKWMANLNFSF